MSRFLLRLGADPSRPAAKESDLPVLAAPLHLNAYLHVRVFVEKKIQAFNCYTEGVHEFACPRKPKAEANRARYWDSVINKGAAEALLPVRAKR